MFRAIRPISRMSSSTARQANSQVESVLEERFEGVETGIERFGIVVKKGQHETAERGRQPDLVAKGMTTQSPAIQISLEAWRKRPARR